MQEEPLRRHSALPYPLIIIFVTLAVLNSIAGYTYYRNQLNSFTGNKQRELAAIAELKVHEISSWREERLGNAEVMLASPIIGLYVQKFLNGTPEPDSRQIISAWMTSRLKNYKYKNVLLLNTGGSVRMAVPDRPVHIGPVALQCAAEALRTEKVVFSGMHRGAEGDIHIDILAPIISGAGKESRPAGVVLLRIDPYQFLYPLIQSWPTPSQTAETLLVRREGDKVVFLNELRHKKNSALSLSFPVNAPNMPAAAAARGAEGVVEGIDYRGLPVLAAIKKIPDSSWVLIAKVDAEEVYAPVRRQITYIVVVMVLLMLCAAVIVMAFWRQAQLQELQKQRAAELERLALMQHYAYMSRYSNDISILFDERFNIVEANERAETVYGYTREELLNKNMRDLRAPETRAFPEKDYSPVLEKGSGLFETVNQRKDGTAFPVEVSARIIEIAGKKFCQGIARDITERKQAEQALRESVEQVRLLADMIEHSSQPLGVGYSDGRLGMVNQAFCELTGYSKEELSSMRWVELTPPEWREQEAKILAQVLCDGEPRRYEKEYIRKDGSRVPIELFVHNRCDPEGKLLYYYAFVTDITERKQTEQKLRESEEQFRRMAENISDGLMIIEDDKPLYINSRACEITGYSREELSTLRTKDIAHPDYWPLIKESQRQFRETGMLPKALEFQIVRKDGSKRFVSSRYSSSRRNGKTITRYIITTDITERRKAEEELAKRIRQQSAVAEFSQKALAGTDIAGLLHEAASVVSWIMDMEFCKIMKLLPDKSSLLMVAGSGWKEGYVGSAISGTGTGSQAGYALLTNQTVIVEDLSRETRFSVSPMFREHGVASGISVVIQSSDGPFGVLCAHSTRPRAFAQDDLIFVQAISNILGNVIERTKTAEELRKTTAFLEDIFTATPDGIMVTDMSGYIARANWALENMLGYAPGELQGKHTSELGDDKAAALRERMVNATRKDGSLKDIAMTFIKKDGTAVPVELNAIALKDRDDKKQGAVAIVHNITEREKAAEEQEHLRQQLIQSQKMEAIGHLAGGIAHDFNNILSAIIGYANLTELKMKEDDPLRANLQQILASSERAANLVHSLLAFSRKQLINPKPVRLNDIVASTEKLLRRVIGEDIELNTSLTGLDTTVQVDISQIDQILINLATNARDAMPDGGSLTIRTGVVEIGEQYIAEHGYGTMGSYALLFVEDTGSGMDDAVRERVFEPFFTTKEVGKGTGLGLSTVYGIVKQHNGFINCYSEPGHGTAFRIYLPLLEGPAAADEAPRQAARLVGGTETILLAEDDQAIRDLTRDILEKFGYRVIDAKDGVDALEKFRKHEKEIQFLLLDVVMPKKNGREVFETIQKLRPGIKALFMSGYTADIIHKRGFIEEGFPLITKPVSISELLKAVREALDK